MVEHSKGSPHKTGDAQSLIKAARRIEARPAVPDLPGLGEALLRASETLKGLPSEVRPVNAAGGPGGLVTLPSDLPVLVLPDLHTRAGLLRRALEWVPPGSEVALAGLIASGRAVLLLLGDIFHSEGPDAPARWSRAYQEFLSGYLIHKAMDLEMGLGLNALDLLTRVILYAPGRVLCLKGNHDNSRNREGNGDHGFYKFADEGAMCSAWLDTFAGPDLRAALEDFEDALPIAAFGGRFAASHAEPALPLSRMDMVEAAPGTVEALTWTDNGQAAPGSVQATLLSLLGDAAEGARWVSGHRPVRDRYALRAGGALVQIHAPFSFQGAWVRPGRLFDPETDILDL